MSVINALLFALLFSLNTHAATPYNGSQDVTVISAPPVMVDTSSLATNTGQAAANASLSSIDNKLTNPFPISGTVSLGSTTMNIGNFPASQPVTGTFWPSTQPVSGTVSLGSTTMNIGNFPSTQPVSLLSVPSHAVTVSSGTITLGSTTMNVGNFPASQPVTGTFWQATQPVSIASMPSTPVTGTFWQSIQPVSGTVSLGSTTMNVGNFPSVQPVSGTFWQTTQPVSGTVSLGSTTMNIGNYPATQPVSLASVPSHAVTVSSGTITLGSTTMNVGNFPSSQPVTGTFWQATQPVSGTVSLGSTTMNVGNFPSSQPVTGTFWQTTQPVSGTVSLGATTMNVGNFPATQPVSGTVSITAGGNPCLNPGATLGSTTGVTSGTAASQIIALSGTTKVYLCNVTIIGVSGTAPTFSLVQGTGSNCATLQNKLIQGFVTGSSTYHYFHSPAFVSNSGQAVCYLDGGTSPVQNYNISYVQQ